MVKPVSYLQTDDRWRYNNYSAKGESKTIGSSGCGITASAMVIASIANKNITPANTAKWSMEHGYKALNQGTYYSYFVPQFKVYGIACKQLNDSNLYGTSTSSAHTEAKKQLKNNNWIIACMGKGNWTSGGHYILVYGIDNNDNVYINDPASTKSNRLVNKWSLFAKEVKYMWAVTVPDKLRKSNNSTTTTTTTNTTTYSFTQFVKDIQSCIGAKVDGIVGDETLSKVFTVSKTKNNRHAIVKPLQKYLNSIGYNCGEVDGVYGNKCADAVIKFQKTKNLLADGIVGAKTWAKILKK